MKFSATQIKLFKLCQRKWAFGYIEKIKAPTTSKQQFGLDMHTELERWLKNGRPPSNTPPGNIAKQGIRPGVLPTPGPKLLIEKWIDLPFVDGSRLVGFVDCAAPPGYEGVAEPLVIDHKSTSDLHWAMKEEELREDPQAIIYALWAMRNWQTTKARSRWVYYAASSPLDGSPRKPKGSRAVECLFDADDEQFQAVFSDLQATARAMIEAHARFKRANDVDGNPRGCGVYGGCPYADRCALTPEDAIAAAIEQDGRAHFGLTLSPQCDNTSATNPAASAATTENRPMNLLEKLKMMNVQSTEAPAAAQAAPVNLPTPAVVMPDAVQEELAAAKPAQSALEKATAAPAAETPAPAVSDAVEEDGLNKSALLARLRSLGTSGAVNPPAPAAADSAPDPAPESAPESAPEAEAREHRGISEEAASNDGYDKMLKADLVEEMKKRGCPVPTGWTRPRLIAWLRDDDAGNGPGNMGEVPPKESEAASGVVVKATDPEGAKARQEAEADAREAAKKSEALKAVDELGDMQFGHPPADAAAVDPPKGGLLPSDALPSFPRSDRPAAHCMPFNPVTGEETKKAQNGTGFVVMFDAVYTKNETLGNGVKHLCDMVKPVADIVAKDNGVEHWGLVEFHRGGPMLAAKFERLLDAFEKQGNPMTGVILADSKTAEAKALREVLVRRAGVVVQGLA